jgi:hypothetical protein
MSWSSRKQKRQITLKVQVGKYFENGGAGGMLGTSEGGVEGCTASEVSYVVSLGACAHGVDVAGGSGWSSEDVVVRGTGGGAGEPSGATVNTGCNGEDVGEKALSIVDAFPLPIVVEGEGEVVGNGAGRSWDMGNNCSTSSSSESLSRNSSASHRRLAAFLVRLAGGEAIVAGEVTSGGVGDGWVDAVCMGAS